jgi:hypothetical protein
MKIKYKLTTCVHPFKSVTAYAVRGEEEVNGQAGFCIHFRCNLCGEAMIMLSKGHVAKPEEREKLEALHEHDQTGKSSQPG